MAATVLCVAEKPSLSQAIAKILSGGNMSSQRRAQEVHEWSGTFQGQAARYKMTSVIGHVLSIDFPPAYQNWDTTDPLTLFDAPTLKNEANPRAHICRHLQTEARGCDYLVLWLDCDREGENICFEVIDNTVGWMRRVHGQQVFRAKFSAISPPEIHHAMAHLGSPNKNEALAVDARQELDLKVGVAFTRFQTRYFQGKYGNLDSSVISYGPCQTPTLGFCVERHERIVQFQPELFWTVRTTLNHKGHILDLSWERGRVFDKEVAVMFQGMILEGKRAVVESVTSTEEVKRRPPGLNTVEMMKVGSASLNMGAHHTMQVAERLYMAGYISYPRTESSGYPANFDFKELLQAQRRSPHWGEWCTGLLEAGVRRPGGGVDVGDHPPITPVRYASESEVGGGDAWRLYDYIARHFIASVSPDCKYLRTRVVLTCGGERFTVGGSEVVSPGYTAVMPWRAIKGEVLPAFQQGEGLPIGEVNLEQGKTSPPDYLSESELIGLMEAHGIGTDASISVHINNVCERNYVSVQGARRMVPTALGITLVRGYKQIDADLCLPEVRSHVEQQIGMIARGEANHGDVVAHALHEFTEKFKYFVDQIDRMDTLFEASFSPLTSTGKPMSKCGKCLRYMKYIPSRPSRLYCPTCEDVYNLPQGGSIKLYKELQCPLDGFELVLYVLGGADGKSYPLCPYCYNDPPFPGAKQVYAGVGAAGGGKGGASKGGMPCSTCTHPGCPHSVVKRGVCACPECEGTMVLDPVSAPNWRLDCNLCSCLVYLPKNAHKVSVTPRRCGECESAVIKVDFNKNNTPLAGGETVHRGCVLCDDLLNASIQVKHGRASMRRRGGSRGRGRGRAGGGRGPKKGEDPKMSFSDF